LLGAGILFGLAVLMKQHALFFAAFGLGWVVLSGAGRRVRRGLAFGMGLVAPYALTALYFAAEGAFERFWFWTVTYAQDYTQQTSLSEGLLRLALTGGPLAVSQWPTVLLATIGCAVVGLSPETVVDEQGTTGGLPASASGITLGTGEQAASGTHLQSPTRSSNPEPLFRARAWRTWLWLFLAVSFLATCPGLLFREHYFLLMAPAVAWLAGVGAEFTIRKALAARPALGSGLVTLTVLAGVLALEAPLLAQSPREISRRCYGSNAFPEAVDVAEFLQQNTRPGEPIAVLGSEPQIYFYAQRPAATGYVYTYALMEIHPHARRMQQEMIRELETQHPRHFVFVSTPHSWLARPGSARELPTWIERGLIPRSRVLARVDILTEDGFTYESRAYWGPEAANSPPASPMFFLVLERLARSD
jgi:hypothetical protein